jgi:hypothetical protein
MTLVGKPVPIFPDFRILLYRPKFGQMAANRADAGHYLGLGPH